MEPIKALLLDLGNVLIFFDHFKICNQLSLFTKQSAEQISQDSYLNSLVHQYDTGFISSSYFYLKTKKYLSLNLTELEFYQIWNQIFWPNAILVNWVQQIKKFLPIYIISNTNPEHFIYIQNQYPWILQFKEFFLSYEIHALKPNPIIFNLAIQRINQKSENILFIDDLKENIKQAIQIGFQTIHYQNTLANHKKLNTILSSVIKKTNKPNK